MWVCILAPTNAREIGRGLSPLQNLGPDRQVLNQIANLFACVLRDLVPAIVLEGSGIRTQLQKIKTVALPRI